MKGERVAHKFQIPSFPLAHFIVKGGNEAGGDSQECLFCIKQVEVNLSAKPVNWQEPITQSELKDILNSHQNRSKNKLIGKNAMTPGHGLLLAKCQVEVGRGCSLFYEQKL